MDAGIEHGHMYVLYAFEKRTVTTGADAQNKDVLFNKSLNLF